MIFFTYAPNYLFHLQLDYIATNSTTDATTLCNYFTAHTPLLTATMRLMLELSSTVLPTLSPYCVNLTIDVKYTLQRQGEQLLIPHTWTHGCTQQQTEIKLRFYIPLNTKHVISETFQPITLQLHATKKLNLTQQNQTCTNEMKDTITSQVW